jgi:hypothetical protein
LLLLSGFATARVGRRRADGFAAVWWGVALFSLFGTVLARAGSFSLAALGACALGAAALGAVGARLRGTGAALPASPPTPRSVRIGAALAGVATVVWVWPPFETYFAAADSTMYVNAGIHLARTGSYGVTGTIAPLLSSELGRALFVSVGIFDLGPYIRLPGGLLMTGRADAVATPAFFPLVSTWTGILAAVGGPGFATFAAPLGMGLAVWALALFAGETFGLATAVVTAVVFLGNFAVWWFGRFTMSEPLTIAFVWGALVFLRRRAPFAAGAMLAIAGLARSETLVFAVAAVAWWAAWERVALRDLLWVAAGLLAAGVVAALGFVDAPNHHLAYLTNDVLFVWARWSFQMWPAIVDGRLVTAAALAPMVPILIAIAVLWAGGDVARNVARVLLTAGLVLAAVVYVRLGGGLDTLRHCRWIATSMSPLGLACGVVGLVTLWRRGGPAGRLAVLLALLVAAVFLPSPRVAPYQPWAMRRYLPVVLPALALAAGALLGALWDTRRPLLRLAAAAVVVATVAWQVPPTLAARRAGYFAGTMAGVTRIAERLPPDALVVVDGEFADVQFQVPLWLVFGRETIMVSGGGAAWRDLLATLVATGRPVYWIQNRYALPPHSSGLAFSRVEPMLDLAVVLPDSPIDAPPAAAIRKVLPLALYGVGPGVGVSMPMRVIQSSRVVMPRFSWTWETAPLAS